MIYYLDSQAKEALTRLHPVFDGSDELRAELQYRLTTMPARPIWLVTLLGIIYGVLVMIGIYLDILRFLMPLFTSWPAIVLEFTVAPICNALLFIFVYHTVHQLRIVNTIYLYQTYAYRSLQSCAALCLLPADRRSPYLLAIYAVVA